MANLGQVGIDSVKLTELHKHTDGKPLINGVICVAVVPDDAIKDERHPGLRLNWRFRHARSVDDAIRQALEDTVRFADDVAAAARETLLKFQSPPKDAGQDQ